MGIDIVPLPYICVPPKVCSQNTLHFTKYVMAYVPTQGGYKCQYIFSGMVLENQDIGNLRWFVQLHCGLYTWKVNMEEVQGSGGHYRA